MVLFGHVKTLPGLPLLHARGKRSVSWSSRGTSTVLPHRDVKTEGPGEMAADYQAGQRPRSPGCLVRVGIKTAHGRRGIQPSRSSIGACRTSTTTRPFLIARATYRPDKRVGNPAVNA